MTKDTKSKCVECGKTLPWHTLNAHKKCWDVIFDRIERQTTLGVGSKVWCNTLPNCLDRVVCLKNGKFCIETIYIDAVTGKWTIEHSTKHKV